MQTATTNTITAGIAGLLESENVSIQRLVVVLIVGATKHFDKWRETQTGPDMVIARPGAVEITKEDGGRTLILPWPKELPKVYAMPNETGGVTVMLADEY